MKKEPVCPARAQWSVSVWTSPSSSCPQLSTLAASPAKFPQCCHIKSVTILLEPIQQPEPSVRGNKDRPTVTVWTQTRQCQPSLSWTQKRDLKQNQAQLKELIQHREIRAHPSSRPEFGPNSVRSVRDRKPWTQSQLITDTLKERERDRDWNRETIHLLTAASYRSGPGVALVSMLTQK